VLALAACGGSSYGGSAATQPSASQQAGRRQRLGPSPPARRMWARFSVDQNGKTLYAFAADAKNHSNCSGSCAQ
jgi:predicted lipoprotein with Yx(FWY)xxD motif